VCYGTGPPRQITIYASISALPPRGTGRHRTSLLHSKHAPHIIAP
jgi:hypothetical protein